MRLWKPVLRRFFEASIAIRFVSRSENFHFYDTEPGNDRGKRKRGDQGEIQMQRELGKGRKKPRVTRL